MNRFARPQRIIKHALITLFSIAVFTGLINHVHADETKTSEICSVEDRLCMLKELENTAKNIDQKAWRDQTYRELAKTLAFEGKIKEALAIIDRIESPDTKAMTIRGIGMVAAENEFKDRYDEIFTGLRAEAEKIEHPPSYAIALTYIAMSQAFAKDNEGAWKTASEMENDALRHKAYGETAEIQAEHGDYDSAMKSIGFIESEAFRNKAYSVTSRIFATNAEFDKAYKTALNITNAYKKSAAIQYVLDMQKPREQEKDGRKGLQ